METSDVVKKPDLASLKLVPGKLDIDKFKTVPIDLPKLNHFLENRVVKK